MKKIIVILLALICILTACEKDSDEPAILDTETETETETEITTTEAITEHEVEVKAEIDPAAAKEYIKKNYSDIVIDGSTSMIPLHESLDGLCTYVKDIIYHSRTVEAFEMLITGENDILLGVDYSDELLDKARAAGVELVQLPITREAFIFLRNRNNPVTNLTTAQIKDIYSGKLTNWNEIGGDDAPITAYQRNGDSGSQMRMVKFMGDTPLTTVDVTYFSSMGWVIERMADYDEGLHSIAYNIYTFAEKQYTDTEVTLLSVDGVYPNDDTVFDGTYPLNIYNYIYYDANNTKAAEYALNLHAYLMSDEGQQLISDSGYVNLNKKLDRNLDVFAPHDYRYDPGRDIGFYDEKTGKFFDTDDEDNLLIFDNYPDYVLQDSEYKDDEKVREFLTFLADSEIELSPYTAWIFENTITIQPWFDASLDPDDFFNIKYNGKYYFQITYNIDTELFELESMDKEIFDIYFEEGQEITKRFTEYTAGYETDAVIEITKADLENVYFRKAEYIFYMDYETAEINYYQPFKGTPPTETEAKQYVLDNYTDIAIDGSTSMIPLHESLRDMFTPDSDEWIQHSKTVTAFEKLLEWEKLILLSVDFSDELMVKAADKGVDVVQLPITREAFVFLINRNNPVKSLTVEQIKDIYSGKITNWKEVGGDDAPIRAFQRNSDSGSQIRMMKFMGDTPLMTTDVEYITSMGGVIERLASYDEGLYSIAYNFYTFTEKQYINDEVTLLSVDGVFPDDDTIFDGTYPITTYNYVYYNSNNAESGKFAENLQIYLLSDEGQRLISDAGYVNLNTKLDRNKDREEPYEFDADYWKHMDYYDPETDTFYDVSEDNKLLTYDNYADFILHDSEYIDDEAARKFITLVYDTGVMKSPFTISFDREAGTLELNPWWDAVFDPVDLFNFKYGDVYYSRLEYNLKDGKIILFNVENIDSFREYGDAAKLAAYMDVYIPDISLEITYDDLQELYLRFNDSYNWEQETIELKYGQRFKAVG